MVSSSACPGYFSAALAEVIGLMSHCIHPRFCSKIGGHRMICIECDSGKCSTVYAVP